LMHCGAKGALRDFKTGTGFGCAKLSGGPFLPLVLLASSG
jgi:hypothetical protein